MHGERVFGVFRFAQIPNSMHFSNGNMEDEKTEETDEKEEEDEKVSSEVGRRREEMER